MSKNPITDEPMSAPAVEAVDDDALSTPLAEQAVAGTAALNPQDFDLAGWLAGVQPIRRSVTVYAREDLRALVDELAELEMVTPAGGERDKIVSDATELQEQIRASGATFVVEGRTPTWVKAFHKDLDKEKVEDPQDRMLRQIAVQVVEPPITVEDLNFLMVNREDIVQRLLGCVLDANTKPGALNPRFLRGASA